MLGSLTSKNQTPIIRAVFGP